MVLVDWAGSGGYTTIQQGCVNASPGDTILIRQGTYSAYDPGADYVGIYLEDDNFTDCDPMFCDGGADDYKLDSASPCADDTPCTWVGAFETGCGANSAGSASWGRLKTLFR